MCSIHTTCWGGQAVKKLFLTKRWIATNVLNIDPNEVAAENKYIKAEKGITKIFFDGKGRKVTFSGIYIEEENLVEVILRNGKFCAAIGQRLIYKAKGELILSIEGNVELYGSSATFGPSSFGSFPCVEAEVVSIHIEKESKLSMQGGRTFEAVIKGTNNRTNVISSPSIVFYN